MSELKYLKTARKWRVGRKVAFGVFATALAGRLVMIWLDTPPEVVAAVMAIPLIAATASLMAFPVWEAEALLKAYRIATKVEDEAVDYDYDFIDDLK